MSSGGGEGEWAVGKLFVGHRSRSVDHHRWILQEPPVAKWTDTEGYHRMDLHNGIWVVLSRLCRMEVIELRKVFHLSFGELSEDMSTWDFGVELGSKLGSMLQTAWLQSQAATANDNHNYVDHYCKSLVIFVQLLMG